MQFGVPQFTDVEDKIIGPLTIKQFLVVLAAGGLCLFFWSLPIPKIVAIVIDLPIALIGIALAFGTYNGRPALTYIFPFVSYLISPRHMVFKREATTVEIIKSEPPKVVPIKKTEEDRESRLKKLAYLLDQKKIQEKELLEQSNARQQEFEQEKASAPAMKIKMPKISMPNISMPSMPKFPDLLKDFHDNKKVPKNTKPAPATETSKPKPKNFQINPNQHSILD